MKDGEEKKKKKDLLTLHRWEQHEYECVGINVGKYNHETNPDLLGSIKGKT